ncbi:MAG: chloride channel protein, partial [Psychrobium sp.]|nr:chloride channel protein [Psychrobium sp.]
IVGLSAVLFNRSLLGIMKLSANVRMSIRLPLAGIIVGGIAWFVPNIMGTDIGALSIAFSDNPELSFLIMVLVGKFVATVCALGLGIPGGVIGVLYAIGALLGSVLVWSIIPFFPQLTPFASLTVMICMVAMMATSLNAPLAALVAVLEMSGNAAIIFPSLLVIVPAILLAQQFFGQKSLFFAQLDIQKLNYKTSPVMFSLQDTGVIALMRRKFTLFSDDQPWKEHDSSRLPLIKIEASEPQYFMPSNLMGYGDDNIVLTQLQTLPANATLAEAYRCLKELRRGYILILSQNEQRPIGLISWRALLKHLHVTQKS